MDFPGWVGTESPERPKFVLWMELPERLILYGSVEEAGKPERSFAESLQVAMTRPMVGPPRRPDRVRIESFLDAESLRGKIDPAIEIDVDDTPELDDFLEDLGARFGEEGPEPTYLAEPSAKPELVRGMFAAAKRLYEAAPWKHLADDETLRVDVPELDVKGMSISVTGELDESLGVIAFPSPKAYEAFAASAEVSEPGAPVDLATSMLALTFEPTADIPAGLRREAMANRWPIGGPKAFPLAEYRACDGLARLATGPEMLLLTRVAEQVVQLAQGARPGAGARRPKAATRKAKSRR